MKDTFAVLPSEDCWILEHNGSRLEVFRCFDQARRAAVALARMQEGRGREAEVSIEPEARNSYSASDVSLPTLLPSFAKLSLGAFPAAHLLGLFLPALN